MSARDRRRGVDRLTTLVPLAIAAAAPLLLALAFFVGSTPDEEEFRFAILGSFLHVRALAEGTIGTWTSPLGFGIPQPMSPNFDMHPLMPLLALLAPATWGRLLVIAHSILGAAGMWQLGRTARLTPLVRAVCVFTFLLATPTQNYILGDFWPSHYVMWTTAPWLLLMAWRLLATTGDDIRRWSIALGICAGLALASTNAGHAPAYSVVVLAVVLAEWRAVLVRWRWLALSALIAIAIAGPSLVQLANERAVFAADMGLVKLSDALPGSAAWDIFLRPFSSSEHTWQVDVIQRGARTLFFGGPFAVLALLGAVRFARDARSLVLGAGMAFVMLFTPLLPTMSVHRYHFRDPLILCAVPLAGLAADRLLRLRGTRPLALLLLAVQLTVVAAGASPYFDAVWSRDAREATWFRGATADAPTVDTLLAMMPTSGRLAYSPQLDAEVSQRERLPDGLGINALAYRGISIVNGSFKGISADVLWPDDSLFYGRIRLPQPLIVSDEGLDLLGIRYVLANPGEALAPGLRERGSVPKSNGMSALLYENPDASPGAVVLAAQPREIPALQAYPDCPHDRLLCKDLTPLTSLRRPDRLDVTRAGSRIAIDLDAGTSPRILVVAEMFRPEWKATSAGRDLETLSIGPGLLGVVLPTAASDIRLDYRAPMLVAANVVAWGVLALGVAILCSRPRRTMSS